MPQNLLRYVNIPRPTTVTNMPLTHRQMITSAEVHNTPLINPKMIKWWLPNSGTKMVFTSTLFRPNVIRSLKKISEGKAFHAGDALVKYLDQNNAATQNIAKVARSIAKLNDTNPLTDNARDQEQDEVEAVTASNVTTNGDVNNIIPMSRAGSCGACAQGMVPVTTSQIRNKRARQEWPDCQFGIDCNSTSWWFHMNPRCAGIWHVDLGDNFKYGWYCPLCRVRSDAPRGVDPDKGIGSKLA